MPQVYNSERDPNRNRSNLFTAAPKRSRSRATSDPPRGAQADIPFVITEGSTAVRLSARAARAGADSSPASRRPAKARPATRTKAGEPSDSAAPTPGLRLRQFIWVAGAIAWALVLLSLLSYPAAAAPSASTAPHNNPPANRVGRLGALIAHFSYLYFGLGAWVLVALSGVLLGVTATGRRATHLPVRILGALLMAAAVAGLQALALPTSGPVSGLGGGLVGTVGVSRLMPGLNVIGTLVALLAALWIGALVALDVWALIAAMWTGKFLVAAGRTGGRAAIAAAQAARHRRSAAALAQTRENDIDDDRPDAALPARPRRARRDEAAADEAEMLETMGGGAPAASVETIDEDSDESEEDAANGSSHAAGGPKTFDPEQLRAKIANLPVRFATQTRRSATEDDLRAIQNSSDMEGYRFPGVDLLEEPEGNYSATMEVFVREQAEALERAIKEYGIEGEVVGVESGPVITLFELRLAPGTKVSQLQAIASDVARSLKAVNIRIVSNMAGRDTVGVEVPNAHKEKVRLKELMTKSEFYGNMRCRCSWARTPRASRSSPTWPPCRTCSSPAPPARARRVHEHGHHVVPLHQEAQRTQTRARRPQDGRTLAVQGHPHLMCPVVTEMAKAAAILEWAVTKMDERYELLAEAGCRDIVLQRPDLGRSERTAEPADARGRGSRPAQTPLHGLRDRRTGRPDDDQQGGRAVDRPHAQKARAVGIHLILATQRPQANVVTGLIKSNMPAHQFQGRQRNGLAHRARPEGRRVAAGPGRHALSLARSSAHPRPGHTGG